MYVKWLLVDRVGGGWLLVGQHGKDGMSRFPAGGPESWVFWSEDKTPETAEHHAIIRVDQNAPGAFVRSEVRGRCALLMVLDRHKVVGRSSTRKTHG